MQFSWPIEASTAQGLLSSSSGAAAVESAPPIGRLDAFRRRREDWAMSTLEVYWGSGSQPSWRVLLALELKRIPYESHLLSFSAGEHKTPAFTAMNPRHKVPVIKHGDFVLFESVAILAYLDRCFPEVPLLGRDAQESGLIWRSISEFQSYLEPVMIDHVVRPIFFGKAEERRADLEAHLPKLHAELQLWEQALVGRSWIVGNSISAADIVMFPSLMSLLRAATRPAAQTFQLGLLPLESTYPNLAAWVARISALPSAEKTYPPHWRAGS